MWTASLECCVGSFLDLSLKEGVWWACLVGSSLGLLPTILLAQELSCERRCEKEEASGHRAVWVHYINGDGFVSIVNLKPALWERHRKLSQREHAEGIEDCDE